MIGPIDVEVYDNLVHYKFTINRNITIIKGNSAVGKTVLVSMIRSRNLGDVSKVVKCKFPCISVNPDDAWKSKIKETSNSIIFFDEDCRFTQTSDFAETIQETSNYYVIATRKSLDCLPYSIEEIYEIVEDKRYPKLSKVYNTFQHIYSNADICQKPSVIITEDSKAGYQFFKSAVSIPVIAAKGKDRVYKEIQKLSSENIVAIVDGAAFGSSIERTLNATNQKGDYATIITLESFEYAILKSKLFYPKYKDLIDDTRNRVDSEKYFSWERYFTGLLSSLTKDSDIQRYKKEHLSGYYKTTSAKSNILEVYKQEGGLIC